MDEDLCSICLENNSPPLIRLKCDHIFHNECIIKWINKDTTCPVCRNKVNLNLPFIASENLFYRNKIIVLLNDETLTIFKNNELLEIILYSSIRKFINNTTHVKIILNGDKVKKLYMSSKTENTLFFTKLKEKIDSR